MHMGLQVVTLSSLHPTCLWFLNNGSLVVYGCKLIAVMFSFPLVFESFENFTHALILHFFIINYYDLLKKSICFVHILVKAYILSFIHIFICDTAFYNILSDIINLCCYYEYNYCGHGHEKYCIIIFKKPF